MKHYARVMKRGSPLVPKHGFINRGAAKLTKAKVRKIRKLRSEGVKLKDLVARFKVTEAAISMAAKGRTWGDLKTYFDGLTRTATFVTEAGVSRTG